MKKIKDVSRITGLSKRTLQYYDDLGLVKAERTRENYRLYSDEDMRKLWEILVYKEMGFQLDEIAGMLDGDAPVVHQRLENRLRDIETEMNELAREHRLTTNVLEHGMPGADFDDQTSEATSYKDMVRHLVKRV